MLHQAPASCVELRKELRERYLNHYLTTQKQKATKSPEVKSIRVLGTPVPVVSRLFEMGSPVGLILGSTIFPFRRRRVLLQKYDDGGDPPLGR